MGRATHRFDRGLHGRADDRPSGLGNHREFDIKQRSKADKGSCVPIVVLIAKRRPGWRNSTRRIIVDRIADLVRATFARCSVAVAVWGPQLPGGLSMSSPVDLLALKYPGLQH